MWRSAASVYPKSVAFRRFALPNSIPARYPNLVKVSGVQFDIAWEAKEQNYRKVEELVRAAAPPPGSLVALPEMFATGFSMNAAVISEPHGGTTERFLGDLARSLGVYLVAGAAMRDADGRARNKALVFSPQGELTASYAKMRPFSPGGEDEHYSAGERPMSFHAGECTVAPLICYDLRFPELFRASAARCQPELYVVIASWPAKRIHHWLRLLQARAIENQAFVLGVNRIGRDPFYEYPGRSVLVNADGEILADGQGEETVISGVLDLAALAKYRAGLPFLRDLRLD